MLETSFLKLELQLQSRRIITTYKYLITMKKLSNVSKRKGIKGSTRDFEGFTIIELLVVITIIGFLSSVILVALAGAKKRSGDARVISDIHQLKIVLESNRSSNYAIDLNGAGTNNWQTTAGSSTNINNLINDVIKNGGTVTIQTAGTPTTAYLLYGGLPSSNNSKFFCVSSINSPDPSAPNNTTAPTVAGSPCP